MVASQEMHLSHYKIVSVIFAYLLGDLSAYTYWYGAMSVMTNQLCPCVWHFFFLYILVKSKTVYLAVVFAIHWPYFVNGLSMCDIINNRPVSCTVIFQDSDYVICLPTFLKQTVVCLCLI